MPPDSWRAGRDGCGSTRVEICPSPRSWTRRRCPTCSRSTARQQAPLGQTFRRIRHLAAARDVGLLPGVSLTAQASRTGEAITRGSGTGMEGASDVDHTYLDRFGAQTWTAVMGHSPRGALTIREEPDEPLDV